MSSNFDQFTGTDQYIVSQALRDVVNVSIALGRPLVVKGEPGTGIEKSIYPPSLMVMGPLTAASRKTNAPRWKKRWPHAGRVIVSGIGKTFFVD